MKFYNNPAAILKNLFIRTDKKNSKKDNSIGKTTIEILRSGLTLPQTCYAQDGEDLVLARLL